MNEHKTGMVNGDIISRLDKQIESLKKENEELKKECEAVLPGCNGRPETVHHKIGRGINILNVKTWLACCFSCHVAIELNPDFAKDNGFSESRLSKK